MNIMMMDDDVWVKTKTGEKAMCKINSYCLAVFRWIKYFKFSILSWMIIPRDASSYYWEA